MPRQVPSLTLAEARGLIAAGEKKAQELGIPYNIAVVDAGGGLIAHARMDGAWLGSIDISIHKAPVKVGDVVVGAVGASGGTVDQDLKGAEAAVSAFKHTH
jgi:uncharacterized protein GlcG (DUF336 family)